MPSLFDDFVIYKVPSFPTTDCTISQHECGNFFSIVVVCILQSFYIYFQPGEYFRAYMSWVYQPDDLDLNVKVLLSPNGTEYNHGYKNAKGTLYNYTYFDIDNTGVRVFIGTRLPFLAGKKRNRKHFY